MVYYQWRKSAGKKEMMHGTDGFEPTRRVAPSFGQEDYRERRYAQAVAKQERRAERRASREERLTATLEAAAELAEVL